MKGPYGFELTESCENCKLRSNGFFCQLSAGAVKDLDAIKFSSAYPEGAVLFIERQTTRGVYILCEGQVKLSISSSEGKKMILRIAKAGEVLGLVSALAGTPHEVTAETLRPAQVAFIPRDAFLRFIAKHPEAYPDHCHPTGRAIQRGLRTSAQLGPVRLGSGKTGEVPFGFRGKRAANERRHANQIASHA